MKPRHVLITGAAGGLGRVVAGLFATGGDRIYGCDVSAEAVKSLEASGITTLASVVNIADRSEVQQFFELVWSRTDRIDVLINNVGVAGPRAPLEQVDPADWAVTLDANVNAAFWTLRQVLPGMKQRQEGVVLNVTTPSVRTLPEWRTPYIVSKAALESLSLAVAREAGPFNVRCNAVQPGMMDNERSDRVLQRVAEQTGRTPADVERELLQFTSMRSRVSMHEVASMIHYLASDEARHVTGQVIAVDGGLQWEG